MNTIQNAYKSYEELMPKDAGEIQRKETKRAFYAGALTMFTLLNKISNNKNENIAIQLTEGLYQELELYKQQVLEGKE